jgi:mediator of RNA polymerase II transcription subunit 31
MRQSGPLLSSNQAQTYFSSISMTSAAADSGNNATASSTTSAISSSSSSSSSLPPDRDRFELELEFVQCLASPAYLHYLATSGILYQSTFLDFLRYLRYWKLPQYAQYLTYPNCLYFLDLLVPPPSAITNNGEKKDATTSSSSNVEVDTGEAFRREIAHVPFRNFVHEQQFYSWQFRSARLYGGGSTNKEVKVDGEDSSSSDDQNK